MSYRKFPLLVCVVSLSIASLPAQTFARFAARVVGQNSATPKSFNPNIVDGRGLWEPRGIAFDTSVSPPRLYVSDTLNHRVLGWADALSFSNGAEAQVVIGQRDRESTTQWGPGTAFSQGLNEPTGVAVDAQGNVYVVDSGNNRILRFPRPFNQPDETKTADLVIGQASTSSGNRPNRGGAISAEGISTPDSYGVPPLSHGLHIDAGGNLWFADAGNHRVLRFPSDGSGGVRTTADVVLGQADMASASPAPNANERVRLRYPTAVITGGGNIYVADELSRVVVFSGNPLPAGTTAVRVVGLRAAQPGQPAPDVDNIRFALPKGLVMIGNRLAVVDTFNNRVMVFDPFSQWPAETSAAPSPSARSVVGQADFTTNRGSASDRGLRIPFAAAATERELFVVDTGNNRVLVFPVDSQTATRILGQADFGYNAPNLLEGRELYLGGIGSIAVDSQSNPPRLYIADTQNNRVLCYCDARKAKPGDRADLVIGQPTLVDGRPNYQPDESETRSESSLMRPTGLVVDAQSNLIVADSGNGRVLRFPNPCGQGQMMPRANLVLGQLDFSSRNTDASSRIMASPFGVALTPEGHLYVSDPVHHRVLRFERPGNGDFSNGMAASAVVGQPDFFSTGPGTDSNRMNDPRYIAGDTSGRLYVADRANNRFLVFSANPSSGATPAVAVSTVDQNSRLRNPHGIYVSPINGTIWVSELGTSRVLQYPEYSSLLLNPNPFAGEIIPTATPASSLALDPTGNLFTAEIGNRVALYVPPATATNGASFLRTELAPGMIGTLWETRIGDVPPTSFAELPNPIPMPTTLADIQVTANGTPVPLYYVSNAFGQINFQMPMSAPGSGTVDFLVIRASTQQVLSATRVMMKHAAPAFLMRDPGAAEMFGDGAVAALNGDDIGDPARVSCTGVAGGPIPVFCPGGVRPVKRGEIVVLYLTGQGFVNGAPRDGEPATGQVATPENPRVIIGTREAEVRFSGLAPNLIGVWQINAVVPETAAAGQPNPVAVLYRDVPSAPQNTKRTIIQVQ
jgi:uncharacterized protein (TIGR03437 family)